MKISRSILTICFGTYNRKKTFIFDIKSYLSLNDDRFCIRVQDNCSTDGTWEELQKIEDNRLIICRNESNIGGIPNLFAALRGNEKSTYVMIMIDKDLINIEKLPKFLSFLESVKPYYGYVNLQNNNNFIVNRYEPGENGINNLAYRCHHPSGYFWKSNLLEKEMNEPYYHNMDKMFDFKFDIINAHFAQHYFGCEVIMPLITTANKRKDFKLSKTYTYNEDNFFFSPNKIMEAYKICLDDLINISLDNIIVKECSYMLFRRYSLKISINYRHLMQQNMVCDYYNLKKRVVSLSEMFNNLSILLNLYKKKTPLHNFSIKVLLVFFYRIFQAVSVSVKEIFITPEQTDFII